MRRIHSIAQITALSVFALSCASGQTAMRPLRAGAQRDAAGRTYFELRTIDASYCAQEGHDTARTQQGARDRLAATSQEQGYSGVREVRCEQGAPSCSTGFTCRGIAVRYVIARADGSYPAVVRGPCDPICEGTATCQDGQCTPTCTPACTGGRVCATDATCVQID